MQVQIDLKDRVCELLEHIQIAELYLVEAMYFDVNVEELSKEELIKRYKELNKGSDKAIDNLYKVTEILEIYEF